MLNSSYADISNHHCAMLDGSSYGVLLDYKDFLTDRLTPEIAQYIRAKINEAPNHRFTRYALQVLSGFVVYDQLVIDARALKTIQQKDVESFGVIKAIEIPGEIHQAATQATSDFVAALPTSNIDWLKSSEYWDGKEKEYHDKLLWEYMRTPGAHRLSSSLLADSTYSAPRVFYSSEIARSLRVPLFLHPVKESLIQRMRGDLKGVVTVFFHELERVIDQKYSKLVVEALESLNQLVPIATPPLTAYIFRLAASERLSLLDAALKLRETKEAQEFRKWLNKIQIKLMADDTATRASAAKDLKDLYSLVEDWAEHADPRRGSTHKPRTVKPDELKLEGVPGIGIITSILKALGIEFSIMDRILTPRPYWVFVSNWYEV